MVLPVEIFSAARTGDRDAVLAYLDTQDDAGDARDVNEQTVHGGSVLMAAVCQIDSAARLAFVWELVSRGANLCSIIDHEDTVRAANNYAISLLGQESQRFEEAKALLRKTMPVAQRVFGESNAITLTVKKIYAHSLCIDDRATLDDLHEAVTTLEDSERIARRVLGGAYPLTTAIEDALQDARAALRARETQP